MRLINFAIGAWIASAILSLAIAAGTVYVAAHFIAKFW